MGGMSTYREINGERILVDAWRSQQMEALCRLTEKLERPVTTSELAEELEVGLDDVTHMALVQQGLALLRKVPGSLTKGLWPREVVEPRLLEALSEFRRLPVGETYEWTEPRRTRDRKFKARKMTTSRTLRSRIQSGLRRAKTHLGLRSLKHIQQDHISLLPDAVWTAEMESSLVPPSQWRSGTEAARRARKSANNRRSEMTQFVSWAEWRGYVSLPSGKGGILPDAWVEFVELADAERAHGSEVAARRVAGIAYRRLHAVSPERLVEIGFDRLEEEIRTDPRYSTDRSARSVLSRLRRGWNACADACGSPKIGRWEAGPRGLNVPRRDDGGLQSSWWSAKAFMDGKPTLLDREGMERQRRQAVDMRDWWTLSDPTLRPDSDGGALPQRPERTRQGTGRKKFGARSETEKAALNPLQVVSELQRFALSQDEPAHRVHPSEMLEMEWTDLLSDRARVRRYIRFVFSRSREANDGEYITAGVNKVWYLHTIMWAYFPAWLRTEISAIRHERLQLDLSRDQEMRRAQQLENERSRLELEIEQWQEESKQIKKYIQTMEVEFGGIQTRKSRTEIRRHLSHREIRRMADALRDRRLDLAGTLRKRTTKLTKQRDRDRENPCASEVQGRSCGRIACDEHSPDPDLSPQGIAYEVMTRPYCTLITREAMLRLHSILPWRPGTLRRALLGHHIDPITLELVVRGRDDKVDKDHRGRIKRQEVSLPDLEWWEDPAEIEDAVEVLRLLIDEAHGWLLGNPTKTGKKLRRDGDERRLLLNSYGVPWRTAGTYTSAFQDAMGSAVKLVNANLKDGEDPIQLPTGYGSTGSYIGRFLYGQRIKANGGTIQDIADALGNSPATARQHYQDEQEGETINRIATRLRGAQEAANLVIASSAAPPADDLAALKRAKVAFDEEVAGLELTEAERSKYWAARKEQVTKGLREPAGME